MEFYKGNCTLWGKETIKSSIVYWILIRFWFLTLILGDSRKYCGCPVKVGVYGGQVINRVLAKVQVTAGPVDPQISSYGYFSCPRIYSWDILRIWQNSPSGFLTCEVRATTVGRAKRKPLELPLSRKIATPKQHHFSEGIAEFQKIVPPLNTWKTQFPLLLLAGQCRR